MSPELDFEVESRMDRLVIQILGEHLTSGDSIDSAIDEIERYVFVDEVKDVEYRQYTIGELSLSPEVKYIHESPTSGEQHEIYKHFLRAADGGGYMDYISPSEDDYEKVRFDISEEEAREWLKQNHLKNLPTSLEEMKQQFDYEELDQ